VIACIFYLVNQRELMGKERAGILLNAGLIASFIFACIISYTAALALNEFL